MVIKNRIIMKVFYYIICAACFAGCVSSSNDKTVKENGRTLHNGIVLPEQWPPSMIDDGVYVAKCLYLIFQTNRLLFL